MNKVMAKQASCSSITNMIETTISNYHLLGHANNYIFIIMLLHTCMQVFT